MNSFIVIAAWKQIHSGRFSRSVKIMKLPLKITALLLLLLICSFSPVFAQDFAEVKDGMTREQVRIILGDPELSTVAAVPQSPFFGPQESLVHFLRPGAFYEEWRYTNRETIYLVWFAGAKDKEEPQESWRVITKFSYPKGAVF